MQSLGKIFKWCNNHVIFLYYSNNVILSASCVQFHVLSSRHHSKSMTFRCYKVIRVIQNAYLETDHMLACEASPAHPLAVMCQQTDTSPDESEQSSPERTYVVIKVTETALTMQSINNVNGNSTKTTAFQGQCLQ